jgi:UDP-N-acetylglucosamine 2-epimerase (non-hydrolysing)
MLKVLSQQELENKIAVLVGTRPGIIKMSPIIKNLKEQKVNFFVIHAGQHYSYNMDKIFFDDLNIEQPKYLIDTVKNYHLHGEQTAEMLKNIEKILIEEKPKMLLVCGDANFNLAGALAARKLGIKVAHIESGLRSNDWRMPEEHNRIIIDHISELLFAPTKIAKLNLINDNVKGKIFVFGNTIVDSVYNNIKIAEINSNIMNILSLKKNKFFLITIHREENVDNIENLKSIVISINNICEKYNGYKLIFPIHPRTKDRIKRYINEIYLNKPNLMIIDPVGYLDFLCLIKNARLIITDSGGIQEEACILKTPCVTLRNNTERPESLEVKANILAGVNTKKVLFSVEKMLKFKRKWKNPFGKRNISKKMVNVILKNL